MKPASKKTKLDKSLLIRLCDAFTRTDGNIICPLIKAENSVRVLYKLQQKILYEIVKKAGAEYGLTDPNFLWELAATDRKIDRNVFVKYSTSQCFNENSLTQYQQTLKEKLIEVLNVKHILIDRVEGTENIIPQPIISETSFEFHKLKLCYEGILDNSKDINDQNANLGADLFVAADTMKSHLEDLKGHYTKFAVLSQNGLGKSFILNLLLLLTSDNEEEYRENNRNLKLPQAIEENKTVDEIVEEDCDLPDVVKDVLTTTVDRKQKARAVIDPLCCELPMEQNDDDEQSISLSSVGEYFSEKKRIDITPYILAEKETEGSYETTTKCIIHLRYGTVYQISVKYFTEEELQQQLFELVTLSDGESSNGINESIKEKAKDCLEARFKILTDIPSTSQEMEKLRSPNDILLSREVAQFAGKTELYIGEGKESKKDRLAMQSILRQITTSQEGDEYKKKIAAVKQIIVYLPSKILYGGKEILEMPGTDDSDPMAMNFIETALNEVDAVIVISYCGIKIAGKEVKDMLSNSDFVKNWKEKNCNHKLMLLAYPEKIGRFQYGEADTEKIKTLEKLELDKRKEELKCISKLFRMEDMMDSKKKELEASIITSYILPVLHTSILAQPSDEGKEYMVFQENEVFLQYTGISSLITMIDSFVSSRQKSTTEKIRNQISHFCQEMCDNSEGIREAARTVQRVLNKREIKSTLEDEINRKSEHLLKNFKHRITGLISEVVDTKVKAVLKETVEQAKNDWMKNKDKIKNHGVFNPYFAGKNPVYKVLLFNIFFDGFKVKETAIFQEIRTRIEALLQQYKVEILNQLMQDLNKMLGDQQSPFTLEFVKNAIGNEVDDALSWYVGNVKRPFNEKTMKKICKKIQYNSIRRNILEPNFKTDISLETAKQNAEKNIEKCIMEIKESFFADLSVLHEERIKCLNRKLKGSKGSSKMWQRLVYKLKEISKQSGENHSGTLNDSIVMMSVKFNEP